MSSSFVDSLISLSRFIKKVVLFKVSYMYMYGYTSTLPDFYASCK